MKGLSQIIELAEVFGLLDLLETGDDFEIIMVKGFQITSTTECKITIFEFKYTDICKWYFTHKKIPTDACRKEQLDIQNSTAFCIMFCLH